MVEKMIIAGVDVARINMSHYSDIFDIDNLVKNIRNISKKLNRSVSIMMDLPGPKIRTSNEEIISIKRGNLYTLGLNAEVPLDAQLKFKGIKKGAKVKIDDGK
ncbi:MAG TPA: pyruvate kinase, partial [Candidatus Marinimicrobia bacterium]|nr:pyruvate kinase [Candidatus Neomarinimicrobiota bacterium]